MTDSRVPGTFNVYSIPRLVKVIEPFTQIGLGLLQARINMRWAKSESNPPRHGDVEDRAEEQEHRELEQSPLHAGILRRCFTIHSGGSAQDTLPAMMATVRHQTAGLGRTNRWR